MKYRVKHVDKTLLHLLFPFIFPFNCSSFIEYKVQYKKHWWNKWTTCDNYDRIEDAYVAWLEYVTDGKCILPLKKQFQHNRDKNKIVTCELVLQKNKNPISKEYTYIAGYKPHNYIRFYYACYSGESFEDVISKLWGDMEVHKLINNYSSKYKK